MIMPKAIVFAALVVALAVHWKAYGADDASWVPDSCKPWPTSWQCTNEMRWNMCMGMEKCLIVNGVAI